MKVLFVQQEMGRRKQEMAVYPIGLASLASVISGRHEVRIFDPNLYGISEGASKLKELIHDFNPDICGISIKYIDTTQKRDPFIYYNSVPATVRACKEVKPSLKVIAGGAGFSLFPNEIMNDIPEIDLGIYLEGEDTIVGLLDNLNSPELVKGVFFRKGNEIIFSGPRDMPDFSKLTPPEKDPGIIEISKYVTDDYKVFGVQSKRGCAFGCIYCNYPHLNGSHIRVRVVNDVVDEIEFMVKNHGLKAFNFADNVFNLPEDYARQICLEIIKRGLQVEWGAWYDLGNFSKELLDIASSAGCKYFQFSPDAVTDEGLGSLNKRIKVSDIYSGMKILKNKKEVFVAFDFFCSYPKQTIFGSIKTALMFFKIVFTFPARSRVHLGWIRIMPNTGMHNIAVEEGFIPKGKNLFVKTPQELEKLFYTKKSLFFADLFFYYFLNAVDYFLKPVIKLALRLLKKKYRFYYP